MHPTVVALTRHFAKREGASPQVQLRRQERPEEEPPLSRIRVGRTLLRVVKEEAMVRA